MLAKRMVMELFGCTHMLPLLCKSQGFCFIWNTYSCNFRSIILRHSYITFTDWINGCRRILCKYPMGPGRSWWQWLYFCISACCASYRSASLSSCVIFELCNSMVFLSFCHCVACCASYRLVSLPSCVIFELRNSMVFLSIGFCHCVCLIHGLC